MAFAPLRITFLLAFFASVLCYAQEPVEVSACDLATQPQKYNNKVIKVRAQVSIAFEDFTLETPDCGEKLRPIWLAYGGDEPTPTTPTVNDQDRKTGSVPKLNGRPVPLLRDASLELFKKRLAAVRLGGITSECMDRECYLYELTATLTGVFAAAPDRALGGYGHLGCCHLVMIQQVSDVDAKRTAVPAGGSFSCSTETWNMTAAEAELRAKRRPCQSRSDCRLAIGEQLQEVARHWNEEISLQQGTIDGIYTGLPTWRSPDLLKSYSLRFQYTDKRGKRDIAGAIASRTGCTAVNAPFPIETPIACRRLWLDSSGSKDEAAESGSEEWRFAGPEVASRAVLQELSKQWTLDLLPTLNLRECSTSAVDKKDQAAWCEWIDSTSMQAFSVTIIRHTKPNRSPWALWHASGVSCTAETTELGSKHE